MADDNWKHRSRGMTCYSCMWFVKKERVPKIGASMNAKEATQTAQEQPHVQHDIGRCRRHAPTMAGFPVVFVTDWCGDHKLDEEKV